MSYLFDDENEEREFKYSGGSSSTSPCYTCEFRGECTLDATESPCEWKGYFSED